MSIFSKKKPQLTIMQRVAGASKLQKSLNAAMSRNVELEAELTTLRAKVVENQSAALIAEQKSHAGTRKLLEAAKTESEVSEQKISLRAVEILAEAGHDAGDLPGSHSGGGSSTDGLTGRARLDAAVRNDNPELFE